MLRMRLCHPRTRGRSRLPVPIGSFSWGGDSSSRLSCAVEVGAMPVRVPLPHSFNWPKRLEASFLSCLYRERVRVRSQKTGLQECSHLACHIRKSPLKACLFNVENY